MPKVKDEQNRADLQQDMDYLMKSPTIETAPSNVPGYTSEELDAIEHEIDLEEKYGDRSIEAFATGAARGLLPGFDIAATAAGVSKERLQQVKDKNKFASISGEATTLIGGALLSGGGNIATKLSLGGVAEIAEKKLVNSIAKNVFKSGVEKTLAKKIMEKSIEKGLAAGTIGAAFGVNTLLNEDALGETDLTGENLIAYAGAGAVLNGLIGGAFGATEALVPVAKHGVDRVTGQLKKLSKNTFDIKLNTAKLVSNSASETDDVVRAIESSTDEKITGFFRDRVKMGVMDGASELSPKMKVAGKRIGEDIEAVYSKVDANSPQGVIPKQESHTKLSQSIDDYVSKNANAFDSRAAKSAIKNVKDHIFNRFKRVVDQPGDLESIKDFWKGAQELGKKANNSKLPQVTRDLYSTAYKNSRELLNNYIETRSGSDAVGALKKLNEEYRLFSAFNGPLQRKANISKSDFITWKDTILSAATGALTSHGIGITVLASKKILESDLKRRLIILNTAQRANERSSKIITGAIKTFFDKTSKSASRLAVAAPKLSFINSGFASSEGKKPKDEKEAFKNISKNLVEYRVNPDKLALKIAMNTMKAGYAAPNSTKFAQITLGTAVSFLYEKMPKDMKAGTDVLGDRQHEPSSIELSKFKRYLQAVENPYSVLQDVESGTVTREQVEALRAVYPAIYRKIQDKTMEYVAEKPSLPYNKKIQLGILLDIPTDASLAPESVVMLQDTFLEQAKDDGDGGDVNTTVTGLKELKLSKRLKTDMQEISSTED